MSNEPEREKNKQPAEFGSDASTGQVFNFYLNQVSVLEDLIKCTKVNSASDRMSSLYPLLFSIHSTGSSISLLAIHGFLNESFMLARAFLERLINYIYLLVSDEDEYLRYLAHTKQKGFRMLDRSIKAGDLQAELKYLGSIELSRNRELKEAIDLFTGKKGGEITRWTSVNLSGMLTVIYEKGGFKKSEIGPIMLALLGIYQDASEALHGTLYGSIFHVGVFTKKFHQAEMNYPKPIMRIFRCCFLHSGYVSIH